MSLFSFFHRVAVFDFCQRERLQNNSVDRDDSRRHRAELNNIYFLD